MQTTSTPPARPATATSPLRRFVGRNMYRWHRVLGLITLLPVVLWTLSGISHPLMSNWLRPPIAHETVPAPPLQAAALAVSVPQVLAQQHLVAIQNLRMVQYRHQPYYQVTDFRGRLRYFAAATGQELPNGDRAYAEDVARYLTADSTSAVASAERLTHYTGDYKFINRLLPVWKITLARPDGMAVFVETEQSRMGTFNNTARARFLWVFGMMHNWDFLDALPRPWHLGIMLAFTTIIWLSALSGLVIYGFVRKKLRQPRSPQDQVGWLRRRHRSLGLWVAFVTFTFALSASYHLWQKLTPDRRDSVARVSGFAASELTWPLTEALAGPAPVQRVSLVRVAGQPYYRLASQGTAGGPPQVQYRSTRDGQLLLAGESLYARELGQEFMLKLNGQAAPATATGAAEDGALPDCCTAPSLAAEAPATIGTPAAGPAPAQANLLSPELITKFAGEYGFVNKRLPVMKLAFATPDHTALYVEPASGRLAALVTDGDRREGLSFAVLHKFFLMDWAGKNVRDAVAILSALGVLVVTLYGFALLLRTRQ
ncbi:PepSY domain-containing protein [Hymenobacter ginsengisoli]|uniref:PepSY domain-containing protein n=1 Tax=Hymenobacter ginsengisoli TaxID=1051626 RepID=A0ABP8QNN0_9BACT|nr:MULTISPECIES: PepSY-associated TM helix domain-containing protein [unclassified Hymenobacter]MBO2032754.1 PepSY domain-containing protein [Hymenobacter sp. BT559]